MTKMRALVAAVLSALFMLATLAGPAAAQQQGLVNVEVGDVTILENVGVGVAAQVAAQICGVNVGPVAVLGAAAQRTGVEETVCTIEQGDQEVPVTIG